MSTKKKKLNAGLNNLFSSTTPPENPKEEESSSPSVEAPVEIKAQKSEALPVAEPVVSKTTPSANSSPVPEEKKETVSNKQNTEELDFFDDDEQQLVVFKLADESYGVDISIVESIIKMQMMTLVPHAYDYVEGVTNLRGTVVPVIDLRARFNMERVEETKDTRIIVIEHEKSMIGVVVDAVIEVLRISPKIIEPPSMFVATLDSAYISGIAKFDDRLITLLDLDKIFVVHDNLEIV